VVESFVKIGDLVRGTYSGRIGIIVSQPIEFVKETIVIKAFVSVLWSDGQYSNSYESQFLEVINESR
tara:strand:- start:484 stop:684 length:201 start_codon:yes stop_codon:yes gene_type:complete